MFGGWCIFLMIPTLTILVSVMLFVGKKLQEDELRFRQTCQSVCAKHTEVELRSRCERVCYYSITSDVIISSDE